MTTRRFAVWMLVAGLSAACTNKEEGPEEMGGQEGEAFDLDGSPGFDGEENGGDSTGGADGGVQPLAVTWVEPTTKAMAALPAMALIPTKKTPAHHRRMQMTTLPMGVVKNPRR